MLPASFFKDPFWILEKMGGYSGVQGAGCILAAPLQFRNGGYRKRGSAPWRLLPSALVWFIQPVIFGPVVTGFRP